MRSGEAWRVQVWCVLVSPGLAGLVWQGQDRYGVSRSGRCGRSLISGEYAAGSSVVCEGDQPRYLVVQVR